MDRRVVILKSAVVGFGLLLAGCHSPGPATQPAQEADNPAIAAAALLHGATLADLTGGDLGVSGGFLIGAAPRMIQQHAHDQALLAARQAEQTPANVGAVRDASSADLNQDGFLTMDEVLAMVRAGLAPETINTRLEQTGFVYRITPMQRRYLEDRGVPSAVLQELDRLSTLARAQ